MALIFKKVADSYHTAFHVWNDPRTESWPLMGSPIPILSILAFYLYFVNRLGPKLMYYREPFKLHKLMIIYNVVQILACSYLVYRAYNLAWGGIYKFICEPVDYSNSEHAIEIAKTVYFYLIIKLADLLDTVFFVLKKKQSHVSFLHVYHHSGMVSLVWSAVTFFPGGHGTSLGVINSIVHIVMYGYYLLTLVDPKKSLWWKKHITQLQIVQFLLLVLHFATLVITPNCEYPKWTAAILIPQNLFMLILFGDFYRKSYMKNNTRKSINHIKNVDVRNGHGEKNTDHID